jgi:DNA-binding NtrC family response regulator
MKANILIIDDEESIRYSFQRFLAAEGYNVITADSYLEALSKLDEMTYDLILADIILEDGWGIDILQEVLSRNLKTSVFIMTAYPTTETIEASFRMEALDYLIKPLRQAELLYFITKALQRLQQMQSGENESCGTVGKAYPIECAAFEAHIDTYSSSLNVNGSNQKGTQ